MRLHEIVCVADLFSRIHVNDLAALALTELHGTIGEGEQCVVLADAHVLAWMGTGTSLANDDGACSDECSVEHLDAEALSI